MGVIFHCYNGYEPVQGFRKTHTATCLLSLFSYKSIWGAQISGGKSPQYGKLAAKKTKQSRGSACNLFCLTKRSSIASNEVGTNCSLQPEQNPTTCKPSNAVVKFDSCYNTKAMWSNAGGSGICLKGSLSSTYQKTAQNKHSQIVFE